jgi:hypothetical protein
MFGDVRYFQDGIMTAQGKRSGGFKGFLRVESKKL